MRVIKCCCCSCNATRVTFCAVSIVNQTSNPITSHFVNGCAYLITNDIPTREASFSYLKAIIKRRAFDKTLEQTRLLQEHKPFRFTHDERESHFIK